MSVGYLKVVKPLVSSEPDEVEAVASLASVQGAEFCVVGRRPLAEMAERIRDVEDLEEELDAKVAEIEDLQSKVEDLEAQLEILREEIRVAGA